MKEKHIFLMFNDLGLGGIQRKMVDIANHVYKDKKYSHLKLHFILRRKTEFTFEKYLKNPSACFHYEPKIPLETLVKLQRVCFFLYLNFLVLKYRPVAILSFLHQISFYAVLTKLVFFWARFKVIISQDNILSLDNKKPYAEKVHNNKLISLYYPLADKIITQTEYAKRDLVKNYNISADKIRIIPNWVVETKLVKKKKEYDLIYCGRFAPQKQPLRLLQAVRMVRKKKGNIRACLIGQGRTLLKIKKYIRENNLERNVLVKPVTHNVCKQLARAKLFVLTSDFEGQPMILLEAMVQKAVPVVLDYPGASEYLKDEYDGYIEEDEEELVKRILFLLANRKKRELIGKNARDTVLVKYNQDLIKKTLSLAS